MKILFKTLYYLFIAGIIGIALLMVAPMFPIPGNIQVIHKKGVSFQAFTLQAKLAKFVYGPG